MEKPVSTAVDNAIDPDRPVSETTTAEPVRPVSETTTAEPRGAAWLMARFHQPGDASFAARYSLVGAWLVLAGVYVIIESKTFLTSGTFETVFGSQEPLVFLGMASVIVFSVGEFDLSVSAMLGLSATLVGVLVVNDGWGYVPACIAATAAATLVGLANGLIVVRLGIDAIVTTLGMSTLVLGIASGISHAEAIAGLSTSFSSIADHTLLLGLPISFFYGLVLAAVIAYVMRFTALGRHMSFVGANREVARLAGVRVARIRIGVYIMSGFVCGVGGVLLAATVGGFDANTSPTYLLPALSATFLGTAAIKAGRFNPLGTMVAIYFLATGIIGLELLGYTGWISDVFYGAALIIAVVISTITRRRTIGAA
jgi:ribose transport system permease protein